MESTMTFEEKVRAMTGKEIVMAMVEGLQEPCTVIDMNTYGSTNAEGICFGCAATNAVCKITGIKPVYLGDTFMEGAKAFGIEDWRFFQKFEWSIDALREGSIKAYNIYAREIKIAQLPEPVEQLPVLNTYNYKDHLQAYIDYANSLPDEV